MLVISSELSTVNLYTVSTDYVCANNLSQAGLETKISEHSPSGQMIF